MTAETTDWQRLALNLRREAELLRVRDALAGIPFVTFKGPLLTRLLYGDLRARASSDIDLYVRPRAAAAALERLLSEGWEALPWIDAGAWLRRHGRVALQRRERDGASYVDLHTQPFAAELFAVSEELIEEHLQVMEVQGQTFVTFDRPLAFMHLIAHFVQHRFELAILRDAAAAWARWEKSLDETPTRELAAQTCGVHAFEFSLHVAHQLGWLERPPPALTRRRARWAIRCCGASALQRAEATSDRYLLGFWAAYLAGLDRLGPQALRGLVLPRDEMAFQYGRPYHWSMYVDRATGPLRELGGRLARRWRA